MLMPIPVEKNNRRGLIIEPIDLIIIFLYYLFSVLLVLGVVGLFTKYYIAIGLIIFLFFLVVFRKHITTVSVKNFKRGLFLFFVVLLIFVGCLLFNGQVSGDAVNYWLPLSREIVRQSTIPDLLLNVSGFMTSRPPLLPLFFASTFSFFGFDEIFALWIPFLFSFLTLIFLYKWCRLIKIEEKYIKFIPFLLLTSPLVLSWGWDLLQESIILFFFVAFFYYFERYKRENTKLNLLLLLFSFVLAVASKETGLFLIIILTCVLLKKSMRQYFNKIWPFATFLPIVVWWTRNFLVYGNPVFPMLNSIFGGKYSKLLIFSGSYAQIYNYSLKNIFERFNSEAMIQFLVILPLVAVALYVFVKKKQFEYIVLVAIFFIVGQFWAGTNGELRYYYPFLGMFLVYFLYGLQNIKSRMALSVIFFVSLLTLFFTPAVLSRSSFIGPIEARVQSLYVLAEFIANNKFIISLILVVFFYVFLSKKKSVKYLVLLILCFYLLKTNSIRISWLNIWLPILGLVGIILGWGLLSKDRNQNMYQKFIMALVIIVFFINTWGLNIGYCLANNKFPYPELKGFTILPLAGEKIKTMEGKNKDFYILTDQPRYLNWYYDYKEIDASVLTFNYITKLKYRDTMNSKELRDLLMGAGVRYIIKSTTKSYWDYFFEKVKDQPDFFEPILQKNGYTLWKTI